jgi:DNA-binding Lrp family transcriptional regulator
MRWMKKPLKDLELRLISELMKNSRRSDRELARAIGASQPTVSRLIAKLEKMGVIKEYTMISNFSKLGFELLAVTLVKLRKLVFRRDRKCPSTDKTNLEDNAYPSCHARKRYWNRL